MERVVIIGGGEAGLIAAAYLERATETDVILVSERQYHVFSFLLYDVLAGTPFNRACLDLPSMFREKDVTVVQGLVKGLDATENRIDLRNGSLHFDTLLITVGGVTKYDIDDRGHVFDIRTDVREIRSEVNSPNICDVVVVGGGPVGVETTATLSSVDDTKVTMITSSRRPISDFPPRASRIAERELRQQGVSFETETRVTEATENAVVLGDDDIEPSDLTVWAGGVRPNPVIESFGLQQNERGLRVDSHLRCLGVDAVYAAGDVVDYSGKVKDGYSAGLEARIAAKNVLRGLRGQRLLEHNVRWHPRAVYLGRSDALLTVNGRVYHGRGPAILRTVAAKSYPFYWKSVY
ncbi:NAD(P)/FAD-dependent oxidoreductase [Halorussus salinisoli]|uniref:NAD(P)/FAD-dependent oxidoreductase n=1 Tax=Halorussus salinisoli TaxID=2558242 RepID=UPI0010C1A2B4|nr:FAD-dependent oxidoreductase [Halorussus salinisoli]